MSLGNPPEISSSADSGAPERLRPAGEVVIPPAPLARVDHAVELARRWLLERQHPDGWWCGELESDTTLESHFILVKAFLGHLDDPAIPRLAQVIRDEALPGGGWSAYFGGPPELSVSCFSYFALKIAGD